MVWDFRLTEGLGCTRPKSRNLPAPTAVEQPAARLRPAAALPGLGGNVLKGNLRNYLQQSKELSEPQMGSAYSHLCFSVISPL